ncbi:DsbA family protein [Isoptericola variabilis]|uniref:DSBA oxidoreductase n=1 Tax=Isoptericola variabilis (strain 225) TaxID=743718 RepID=F6FS88_ISOV2|nr:DsbA family oxidoreductase [Isoptericola variabilis]AEG43029.1 DSBA oxidoreductase [Isoptericola variabilis 225]TWH27066.1 putative DsbA family dithiol-disulfide isomerase [Isoptericola variabilis J7]
MTSHESHDGHEKQPLRIDVWSDVACPWCYIGKRRFARALEQLAERDGAAPAVEVEYHSFELSPDTPVDFEGTSTEFLARHKGIPLEQARQMNDHVTRLAAAEGLEYRMDDVRHTTTLKAHELLHLAKARGLQEPMKERLLRAYFTEGRHVGHVAELADLAAEVGLDRDEVVEALESGRYADGVAADMAQARAYGINGVPFYVIDGRYGVSGAQDPAVFVQVLDQVLAERGEAELTPSTGRSGR